jgi:hypothetical protein
MTAPVGKNKVNLRHDIDYPTDRNPFGCSVEGGRYQCPAAANAGVDRPAEKPEPADGLPPMASLDREKETRRNLSIRLVDALKTRGMD